MSNQYEKMFWDGCQWCSDAILTREELIKNIDKLKHEDTTIEEILYLIDNFPDCYLAGFLFREKK